MEKRAQNPWYPFSGGTLVLRMFSILTKRSPDDQISSMIMQVESFEEAYL